MAYLSQCNGVGSLHVADAGKSQLVGLLGGIQARVTVSPRHTERADAPILGVVPFAETLDQPSVLDLEQMFDTTALAGREHLLRRCEV